MLGDARFAVRSVADHVAVIDIDGDVTAATEPALVQAFGRAAAGADAVVLDFSDLAYMNSGGIGLLMTLLVRCRRSDQELLAFGLSDHYRQILALTRIDEAIAVYDDEAAALAAALERCGSPTASARRTDDA